MNDNDFCDVINCERTSHKTFTNTMLELSLIVEEKVAAGMKGKNGIIMHDGWSKYSRHYVCLLAAYLVDTGKNDASGQQMMESVNTLMTVPTLPQDEEEIGKLICAEKVIVFSSQHTYTFVLACNYLCSQVTKQQQTLMQILTLNYFNKHVRAYSLMTCQTLQ
jgi:hypothetical protein